MFYIFAFRVVFQFFYLLWDSLQFLGMEPLSLHTSKRSVYVDENAVFNELCSVSFDGCGIKPIGIKLGG